MHCDGGHTPTGPYPNLRHLPETYRHANSFSLGGVLLRMTFDTLLPMVFILFYLFETYASVHCNHSRTSPSPNLRQPPFPTESSFDSIPQVNNLIPCLAPVVCRRRMVLYKWHFVDLPCLPTPSTSSCSSNVTMALPCSSMQEDLSLTGGSHTTHEPQASTPC